MVDSAFASVQRLIKKEKVRFIDFKTLDLAGRLHHVSIPAERFTPQLMDEGIGFDASSYGFARMEESDMVQRPDLSTIKLDPFRQARTLTCFMTVHLTDADRTRYPNDVRAVAQRAEVMLAELDIADRSLWGPEFEFYVFDEVAFDCQPHESFFAVHSHEDMVHNAYHAANPFDTHDDLRDEACELMGRLGIPVKYHHHEVGQKGQQEIELLFQSLLAAADSSVLSKYLLFNLAQERGLSLTFMPKPLHDAAGNGWHVHQYLVKKGKNVFYQEGEYANLSQTARYYIGGLLEHAAALAAFTNASTNSYKRLGAFEAPVLRAFGQANRSSAVRIPSYVSDPEKTRIEYRPPDAMGNPYIMLAAMLMAGIDGIVNKLDPSELGFGPHDTNLYEDREALRGLRYLPLSLDESLDALEEDCAFLLRGNVFDEGLIDSWVTLKRQEAVMVASRPHPLEYTLYFES